MMKLFLVVILIVLTAFSLMACGTGEEDAAPDEMVVAPSPESTPTPTLEPTRDEIEPYATRPDFLIREDDEELTVYHFLADLDYLMWVLENNFPFMYTAYWARGIDINLLADNARRAIIDTERLDEDIFFDLVEEKFTPLMLIGHFAFIPPLQFQLQLMLSDVMGAHLMFHELADLPHVRRFYSARTTDDISDFLEYFEARTFDISITIKEDESIAVVTIPPFSGDSEEAENKIIELYARLNDFDHLIIDMRGNSGGWPDFFTGFIMGRHTDIATSAELFVFFKDGEYITRLEPYALTTGILPARAPGRSVFGSIDELLAKNEFPQLVQGDIDRFTYAFSATAHITPPVGVGRVDFDGEVWLLVDERMFSGAQIAAWLAKDTGFATLVGEITGGCWGGFRLLSAMPNTGILFQFDAFYITDRYGRPLEAGTVPHHFNRPGMDAMETVLALIAEGAWRQGDGGCCFSSEAATPVPLLHRLITTS